jgi:hypothetical protein
MRAWVPIVGLIGLIAAGPAFASRDSDDSCNAATGDVAIAARTPQVDLYDGPMGKRVMTMDGDKFPACAPIVGRAPNMMLQVDVTGTKYWVPPHMVKYRFAGKLPVVCRNLAMGSNQQKVGSTRGLGEGCPQTGGHQ